MEREIKGKSYKGFIELISFVPEGLVSVTIGHQGRLIKKIRDESGVGVIVNQRVRGQNQRSVVATGSPRSLAKACTIMYNTLEE